MLQPHFTNILLRALRQLAVAREAHQINRTAGSRRVTKKMLQLYGRLDFYAQCYCALAEDNRKFADESRAHYPEEGLTQHDFVQAMTEIDHLWPKLTKNRSLMQASMSQLARTIRKHFADVHPDDAECFRRLVRHVHREKIEARLPATLRAHMEDAKVMQEVATRIEQRHRELAQDVISG